MYLSIKIKSEVLVISFHTLETMTWFCKTSLKEALFFPDLNESIFEINSKNKDHLELRQIHLNNEFSVTSQTVRLAKSISEK